MAGSSEHPPGRSERRERYPGDTSDCSRGGRSICPASRLNRAEDFHARRRPSSRAIPFYMTLLRQRGERSLLSTHPSSTFFSSSSTAAPLRLYSLSLVHANFSGSAILDVHKARRGDRARSERIAVPAALLRK